MDIEKFVQNIKIFCERKGMPPTVACREAGVGQSFINNMEGRGSIPSVEKVQLLAQYLGVTVSELLGETVSKSGTGPPREAITLRDSAAVLRPDDFQRLTVAEVEMVLAYRRASADDKTIVDAALRKYAKKESAAHEAG